MRRRMNRAKSVLSRVESLEARRLFAVVATQPLGNLSVAAGAFPSTIDLSTRFDSTTIAGTVVRFATSFGGASANIDLELFNQATPLTTANFLAYVNSGRYDATFFHRKVTGFVVQGGGYLFPSGNAITKNPTVVNEFASSPRDAQNKVNTRGTVAMAKKGNDPNSADSEFFFNVADNSSNLDNQNGGFTTFARVLGTGMTVVDQIAALPANGNFSEPFDELPVANFTPGAELKQENVVFVNSARVISELSFAVSSSDLTLVNPVLEGSNLRLALQPNRTGTATITITTTDLDGATLTTTFDVNVSPASTPAVFNGENRVNPTAPSSVNFGAIVPQNTDPVTRNVILENTGSEPLSNLSYTLPAGYSFVGTPPTSVPSGERVNLTLSIDTSSTGERQGNLQISAPGSSVEQFNVPLTSSVRLPVRLGQAVKSVSYVQGTGAAATTVTFTFSGPGVADFVFSGDNLTSANNKGRVTVTGPASLVGVTLALTTVSSNLVVATRGPSLAVIPSLAGAGTAAMNRLDLRKARLTGNLTFGSSGATDAQVRQLLLGEASDAAIALGANNDPKAKLVFSVGSATSTTFIAGYPVNTFTALSWAGTGTDGAISGSNFRTLNVRSDFSSNLTLTGSVNTANISGRLTGGNWVISGSAGRISAAAVTAAATIDVQQSLTGLRVKGAFDGTVSAGAMGSFAAASGDGSTITAQNSIGTVAFKAALVGGFVNAGQSINRFTAQSIDQTRIYAGLTLSSGVLPTALTQFTTASRIGSVTLTARGNVFAFSTSAISARQIGSLKFNAARTVSAGINGIAADTIGSLSFFTDANQRINLRSLNTQTQVPTIQSSSTTSAANLVVRLL